MKPNELEELLRALKPALSSQSKARKILEKYWADKIAIVWTIRQVHRAANERERVLTDAEARQFLAELLAHHNPQYGIKREDLTSLIDQSILGRRIAPKELKLFVSKDVVAIEK